MAGDAYRAWASATGPGGTVTFEGYGAALDREELAAEVSADLVRRVGCVVPGERRAAPAPSARGARSWQGLERG